MATGISLLNCTTGNVVIIMRDHVLGRGTLVCLSSIASVLWSMTDWDEQNMSNFNSINLQAMDGKGKLDTKHNRIFFFVIYLWFNGEYNYYRSPAEVVWTCLEKILSILFINI